MSGFSLSRSALALSALALLAGCAETPVTPTTAAPVGPPPGYWNGDGVPGAAKIVVSLSEQRAYFYKGKNLVGESTISSGKPGFSTPPGHHRVVWKNPDHISTRFGNYVDDFGNVVKSNVDSRKDSRPPGSRFDGAPMPHAMFFRGGYAMHQGYVPPYAASHGCIRLPREMAEIFYNAAPLGTPVIVKQEAVMRTVTVPALDPVPTTVAPPAPTLVRSTAPPSINPAPVRPTAVRYTAPPPIPVRSPASVVSRTPVPVRSPAPALVRSTVPAPRSVRSPAPVVVSRPPVPVRSPIPALVRSTAPAPRAVRSPAPVVVSRPPVPVRSPAPALVRSPAPATRVCSLSCSVTVSRAPVPLRSPAPALCVLPRLLLFGPSQPPFSHVVPLPFVHALQVVCHRHRHLRLPGDSHREGG